MTRVAEPRRPPGPSGSFLRQVGPALKDPLRFLMEMARYGDVVTLRRDRTFLLTAPEDVKRVLQDNHFNYRKGERYVRALESFFGQGLLTSEGDLWKRQRRQIQPAFHRTHHPDYAAVIVATTREHLERWREAARAGTPLDIRTTLTDLTLRIVMRTIFSRSSGEDVDALVRAFMAAEDEMHIAAAFLPVRLPRWVPTPGRVRFNRALRTIDGFIARLIDERQRSGNAGRDFLSLLLTARDADTGDAMPRKQVRDEVITMLAAGHDTVTEALTWTLYLVCGHPDVEARAVAEIADVLGDRDPTADDAGALTFVHAVVQESMRLYPPVWGMLRTSIEPDVLGGYDIPAASRVVLSPYVVHHSPAVWSDPERFVPERFMPHEANGRHRFAYFPFGGGPRLCVGAQFAMLEAPIVAAMLWREFVIRLVPGQTIRPLPRVSLRADGPVWATIEARSR